MDFKAKFRKDGSLEFATKNMERLWNRLRNFHSPTDSYFSFSIDTDSSKNITESQIKLFKRLCVMVSKDTGSDYHEVEKELLKLTPFTTQDSLFGQITERRLRLEELNTNQFQQFLEASLMFCNDIMNSKIIMKTDERFGTILTIEA